MAAAFTAAACASADVIFTDEAVTFASAEALEVDYGTSEPLLELTLRHPTAGDPPRYAYGDLRDRIKKIEQIEQIVRVRSPFSGETVSVGPCHQRPPVRVYEPPPIQDSRQGPRGDRQAAAGLAGGGPGSAGGGKENPGRRVRLPG